MPKKKFRVISKKNIPNTLCALDAKYVLRDIKWQIYSNYDSVNQRQKSFENHLFFAVISKMALCINSITNAIRFLTSIVLKLNCIKTEEVHNNKCNIIQSKKCSSFK